MRKPRDSTMTHRNWTLPLKEAHMPFSLRSSLLSGSAASRWPRRGGCADDRPWP